MTTEAGFGHAEDGRSGEGALGPYAMTVEEALERLDVIEGYDDGNGPRPCVHTLRDAARGLAGAHWSLEDVKATIARYGVEVSGPVARDAGHGLVTVDDLSAVFLATRERRAQREETGP